MMRERGIHILDNFPCFMTTAHSDADIAAIVNAFKEAVRELQEADFIPRRASVVRLAGRQQAAGARRAPRARCRRHARLVHAQSRQPRKIRQGQPMNSIPAIVAATDPDDFNPFAAGRIARVAATTQPQREVWLADRLSEEASLAYNESITLRLHGPLDVAALQGAVQDVINAHEALRSTFSADGQQMIVRRFRSTIDIRRSRFARTPTRSNARCERAVSTRFDLEAGPLVRAEIFSFGATEHALVFTAHHIVCDGWSFGVIVRDLAGFYAARRNASAALRPGDSFAAYADDELRHEGSEAQRGDEAYWLDSLCAIGARRSTCRRIAHAAPGAASARAAPTSLLDAALTADVRKWGAKLGAGLPATLTGAFATLLHRISGATSVVVGLPAAGQSVADKSRLVGHCVNLLPLRFDIDAEQTVARSHRRCAHAVAGRIRTPALHLRHAAAEARGETRSGPAAAGQRVVQRRPGARRDHHPVPGPHLRLPRESARGGKLRAVRERRAGGIRPAPRSAVQLGAVRRGDDSPLVRWLRDAAACAPWSTARAASPALPAGLARRAGRARRAAAGADLVRARRAHARVHRTAGRQNARTRSRWRSAANS